MPPVLRAARAGRIVLARSKGWRVRPRKPISDVDGPGCQEQSAPATHPGSWTLGSPRKAESPNHGDGRRIEAAKVPKADHCRSLERPCFERKALDTISPVLLEWIRQRKQHRLQL